MATSINSPQVMGLGFRDPSLTPKQNTALNQGYEQGTSSPLGMIPGYNFIKGPLGLDKNETFGNNGTSDAQGNVFGTDGSGRAWDPITGRAVASYKDLGSGVKTWSDSYGKLRSYGEGPISSALGSYDNSIYKQIDENPNADGSRITDGEARSLRLRGAGAPIRSTAGQVNQNTRLGGLGNNNPGAMEGVYNNKPVPKGSPNPNMNTGYGQNNNPNAEGEAVSMTALGFDGTRANQPKTNTGVFGYNPGDIVPLSRMNKGFGVIGADSDPTITYDNEGNYTGGDMSITSQGGSIGSITDSVTGKMISTNTMSPLLRQELELRAGNDKNPHHRIIEPDGGGPNGKIKSIPSRIRARNMNEFGDVITDGSKKGKYYNDTAKYGNSLLETRGADNDGDNSTDSNSGGK